MGLTSEINALCQPLNAHLNVNFFNYVHTTKEGERFCLSNQKIWFEKYFELKHYDFEIMNYFNIMGKNYNGVSLWDSCNHQHDSCKIFTSIQHSLDVGFIVFLFAFYETHAESYGFGIDRSVSHAPQIILNNIEVFKRFAQYFKNAAEKQIHIAKQEAFQVILDSHENYTNPFCWGMDPQQKKELFDNFEVEKIYLKNEHAHVFLTNPEAKAALLAARGLTYAEIAWKLNVSSKTIDYRMEKIKSKLKLQHKKDIINLFVNENYLELLEISI